MSRTTPVHSGYTIINGAGSGPNGNRIDVWAEYRVGSADPAGNYTPLTVYFYAALNGSYSSTTQYAGGLNAVCQVDGKAATGVSGGDYDFTDSNKVNFLGSYSGNIPHNTDGKKTVSLSCSFTTVSSYITGGSVAGSITLPEIPRKAAIAGVENAICGSTCRVKWTPAAKNHTFGLTLSVGSWETTVSPIAPDTTAAYSQAVALPLDIATGFSGATGQLTVKLTTYQGGTSLGSHTVSVNLSVPENDQTRPRVTGEVFPVDSPFAGMFLQSKSRVGAKISAQDPLGATITGYSLVVEGIAYPGQAPVGAPLQGSGQLTVKLTATNSRGFTGEYSLEIPVIDYRKPYFTQTTVYRCDLQGQPQPNGESLYIRAEAVCAPVGEENSCRILWRAKGEGGEFTDWEELVTPVVLEGMLSKEIPWTVELQATDTAQSTTLSRTQVPSESVYIHRRAGGKGLGLGGYVNQDDLLDIYWQVNARKPLTAPYINDRGSCANAAGALAPGVYRLEGATDCPYSHGILVVFAAMGEASPVLQLAVSNQGKGAFRIRWQNTWQTWRYFTS